MVGEFPQMYIVEKTTPWPHWVIDDFLPKHEFEYLQMLTKNWPKPKDTIDKLNCRLDWFKFYDETYKFDDEATEVRRILKQSAKRLEKRFDIKNKYKSLHLEYANCGRDYYYRVHVDAQTKFMSNVLYVSPDGDGTRLFSDKNMNDVVYVDWKPNRLVSFFVDDYKYHDYYSTVDDRITFNICFMNSSINSKNPPKRFEGGDVLTLRDIYNNESI